MRRASLSSSLPHYRYLYHPSKIHNKVSLCCLTRNSTKLVEQECSSLKNTPSKQWPRWTFPSPLCIRTLSCWIGNVINVATQEDAAAAAAIWFRSFIEKAEISTSSTTLSGESSSVISVDKRQCLCHKSYTNSNGLTCLTTGKMHMTTFIERPVNKPKAPDS